MSAGLDTIDGFLRRVDQNMYTTKARHHAQLKKQRKTPDGPRVS